MQSIFKRNNLYWVFPRLKSLSIIILCCCHFTTSAQLSVLEQEGLDIIQPVYAKVISDTDTVFIFKNEIKKQQEYLSKLELFAIDTVRTDSLIFYKEVGNRRTFSTVPEYERKEVRCVEKPEKTKEISYPPEYATITETVEVSPSEMRWVQRKCRETNLGITGNGDDCLVWILVEVPARYESITKTALKTPGHFKTIKMPTEYGVEEQLFLKKELQILKAEVWEIEYEQDTIMVQMKWATERIVNTPAVYTWNIDTIWIPEEEQELSFSSRANFKLTFETVEVTPAVTRWVRKPPKNRKMTRFNGEIDEETELDFVKEEIRAEYIRIQKVVLENGAGCGSSTDLKARKIKYKLDIKQELKTPASTTIEYFSPVFEPRIIRKAVNEKAYYEEILHIRATELIHIYKKK